MPLQGPILIVGGGGFIGAAVAARLASEGHDVHALLRPDTDAFRLDGLPVVVHRLSLDGRDALAGLFRQVAPSAVFHLAGGDWRTRLPELQDARGAMQDVGQLLNVIDAAAAATRPPTVFIRAGSLAEYGNGPTPFVEGQREQPVTATAAALVAGTHMLGMLQPRLPFRCTTLRFALTHGALQSDRFLIPAMTRSLLRGKPVTLKRPADRRELLHIDELVDGILAAAHAPAPLVLNLCSGDAPPVADIAHAVIELTGADPALLRIEDDPQAATTFNFLGSPELAARHCGWRAKLPWRAGLARTVATIVKSENGRQGRNWFDADAA